MFWSGHSSPALSSSLMKLEVSDGVFRCGDLLRQSRAGVTAVRSYCLLWTNNTERRCFCNLFWLLRWIWFVVWCSVVCCALLCIVLFAQYFLSFLCIESSIFLWMYNRCWFLPSNRGWKSRRLLYIYNIFLNTSAVYIQPCQYLVPARTAVVYALTLTFFFVRFSEGHI